MNTTELTLSCKDFGNYDVVVTGGGCTGVFAAIRSARLGLRVALVEKSNCFGGVATNGLVGIWHTLFDTEGKEQIIAGLTDEVEHILIKNGYADDSIAKSVALFFDPNAMKYVLDQLVTENRIHIFLHTHYSAAVVQDGRIQKIVVANKDGIGTISGDFFIDASGDGDLCRDAGLRPYVATAPQPPSACYFLSGQSPVSIENLIAKHGAEFGLDDDWGWDAHVPGLPQIAFRADFHVFGKLCCNAKDLTDAEIEGRRKIYGVNALLKKYANPDMGVAAVCSQIGIRETQHFETRFRATEQALLLGVSYEDTIMRGTYRVDVHHQNDNGITFKYLSGKTETFYGKENRAVYGNWREEMGIVSPPARYYQIPFSILVQESIENLIPVGRMLHADSGAFGALRVMVNLNQMGEAAGVAAYLALHEQKNIQDISGKDVQKLLRAGGSV